MSRKYTKRKVSYWKRGKKMVNTSKKCIECGEDAALKCQMCIDKEIQNRKDTGGLMDVEAVRTDLVNSSYDRTYNDTLALLAETARKLIVILQIEVHSELHSEKCHCGDHRCNGKIEYETYTLKRKE